MYIILSNTVPAYDRIMYIERTRILPTVSFTECRVAVYKHRMSSPLLSFTACAITSQCHWVSTHYYTIKSSSGDDLRKQHILLLGFIIHFLFAIAMKLSYSLHFDNGQWLYSRTELWDLWPSSCRINLSSFNTQHGEHYSLQIMLLQCMLHLSCDLIITKVDFIVLTCYSI